MRLIGALIRFFWNIGYAREIKNDPTRRPISIRFGIKSIVSSILAVLASFMMSVLPLMSDGMGGLLIVFWIAIFVAGVVCTAIAVFGAIFNWFLQFYINRNAMTWISLVFLIAGLVGVGFVVFWVSGLF